MVVGSAKRHFRSPTSLVNQILYEHFRAIIARGAYISGGSMTAADFDATFPRKP